MSDDITPEEAIFRSEHFPPHWDEVPSPLDVYGLDGEPISMRQWCILIEGSERILAQHYVGEVWISTVWIGLDHGERDGFSPAMIFETMIFDQEKKSHDCYRYATKEDALEHHAELVAQAELVEGKPARESL